MPKPAPHAHQVTVREVSTGRVFSAWPVDAREMLAGPASDYALVMVEPEPVPVVVTNESPMEERIRTRASLDERSHKDLQALAKAAGINAGQKRGELVDALVPFVVGKVVSLEVLPPIGPPRAGLPMVAE